MAGESAKVKAHAQVSLTRKKAEAEAPSDASAQTAAARSKPAIKRGPAAPSTPPSSAVATIPPVRATALLSPDADAVWRASTDARTAVVRGASAPAMANAINSIAPYNRS